jgi:hypothetical protein
VTLGEENGKVRRFWRGEQQHVATGSQAKSNRPRPAGASGAAAPDEVFENTERAVGAIRQTRPLMTLMMTDLCRFAGTQPRGWAGMTNAKSCVFLIDGVWG